MSNTEKKRLLPARLKAGDTIGIISPGSAASEAQLADGIAQVKALGFKVKLGKNLGKQYGYVGGTDAERVADLHAMFADTSVAGIWCIRGGYGCTRILSALDYQLIKKNPKALIGYSDITALLQAIYMETGLIGFHGPNAQPKMEPYTLASFKQVLMTSAATQPIPKYVLTAEDSYAPVKMLKPGKATGRLAGGNLSLLAAMCGTRYGLDARDKIVLLEDIGEKPYRIDRMLTQLLEGSRLAEAAGILIGQFKNCEAKDLTTSLSLADCLMDRLGKLDLPILTGFSFGHVAHQCTLAIGALARLDADAGQLELLEGLVKN